MKLNILKILVLILLIIIFGLFIIKLLKQDNNLGGQEYFHQPQNFLSDVRFTGNLFSTSTLIDNLQISRGATSTDYFSVGDNASITHLDYNDDLYVKDDLEVGDNIYLKDYLYHRGDTDTSIYFADDQLFFYAGNLVFLSMQELGTDVMKINTNRADINVQISGDNEEYLFFTDGGNDVIGIATSSPATILDIFSTATTTVTIDSSSSTKGGCLKISDLDSSDYTYCYALNGNLVCSAISCE